MAWLRKQHASQPKLLKFWSGLAPGFEYFERSRTLPRIRVDRRGAYRISGPRARRASASAAAAM